MSTSTQEGPNENVSEWRPQHVESMCEVPSAEPLQTVLQYWNTSCFPKSQANCGDETP
jgi:hypothetical protein